MEFLEIIVNKDPTTHPPCSTLFGARSENVSSYQKFRVASESAEKHSPQLGPTDTVGCDRTHVASPYILHSGQKERRRSHIKQRSCLNSLPLRRKKKTDPSLHDTDKLYSLDWRTFPQHTHRIQTRRPTRLQFSARVSEMVSLWLSLIWCQKHCIIFKF